MKSSLFDYDLPAELIAQHPPRRRTDSMLLVYDRQSGKIIDTHFKELPQYIDDSHFMVLNNSRVFKARLFARRETGGRVEIFLVRRLAGNKWLAFLRPSKRIRSDEKLYFDSNHFAAVPDNPGPMEREIIFSSREDEDFIITRYGRVPLPPYIKRSPVGRDSDRYQTVYAENSGSVAAPTAGLHFDNRMLSKIAEKGVRTEKVTLHVGPGTFKPVTAEDIEDHIVDPEFAVIPSKTSRAINSLKSKNKKLLAVGTTSVRTLESAADINGNLPNKYSGAVDLYIYPPYKFKIVDSLLTNFHLPKSSLLMLVAAFCGREEILGIYRHAIRKKYRFYSYGDCMLLL